MAEERRGLPALVYKLGWISFFADVSSEVAYPLIPLFVTETLKASAGALGTIEGAAEAVVSFMKGLSGIHSDRSGRRAPYIQAGYGLSALGKPLMALANIWPTVLLARVSDRIGKGIRTTSRDALIAEATDPKQYGRAYGLHSGMDTAGAFVGVLLAIVLVWALKVPYRTIFLLAGIPGAISFLIAMTVRDAPRPEKADDAPKTIPVRDLPKAYWIALAISLVFGFANSSNTFLLLRARAEGLSAVEVIVVYALYNLVYTFVSYPSGRLSDRYGRWVVLFVGWAMYALVYAGFAREGVAWVWGMFALYGVVIGITTGVNKALVADLAPKAGKGTALGIFYMTSGLMTLISNLAGGYVWARYSPGAALMLWGGASAVAAILVPFTAKLRGRPLAAA